MNYATDGAMLTDPFRPKPEPVSTPLYWWNPEPETLEEGQFFKEVDKQIIERVMQWETLSDEEVLAIYEQIKKQHLAHTRTAPRAYWDYLTQHWMVSTRSNLLFGYPFNPARDMRDAWIVVEHIRAQGFDVDLDVHADQTYGCRIAPKGTFGTGATIHRDGWTMPRAICAAALLWAAAQER